MLKDFELYLKNYPFQFKGSVLDAVEYSFYNAGKRIRPLLLLSLLKDYDFKVKQGYSAALAIEMIHTYSLIHDDLPAMDDDDYRRNKLSNHKVFGVDIAILAGDALLTESFASISDDANLNNDQKVELLSSLSKHAGLRGMVYGQQLDLKFENKDVSLENIRDINIYKTSQLIIFSLKAAAIISNNKKDIKELEILGENLGLAFQIQDDIFDVSKTFEELGKKPSDEENNKSTYVKVLGLDKSKHFLNQLFNDIYTILNKLNLKDDNLYSIIKEIEERNY